MKIFVAYKPLSSILDRKVCGVHILEGISNLYFLLMSTHSWEIDSFYRVETYGQPGRQQKVAQLKRQLFISFAQYTI